MNNFYGRNIPTVGACLGLSRRWVAWSLRSRELTRGIYETVEKKDNSNSIYNKSTFDIIAGSSIGAINATILTSHVIETGSYEGSSEKLIDFWHYLSKESMVEKNLFFEEWWDLWHSIYDHVASGEAARRYYSSKEFSLLGVPNVFTPMTPQYRHQVF